MEEKITESIDLCRFGEDEACRFLRKQKLKILDRNYSVRGGEIDIIAEDKNLVIFIEVKTRSDSTYAQPWENVRYKKIRNLKTAARQYIYERKLQGREFRFDVVSIVLNDAMKADIEWIRDAFE